LTHSCPISFKRIDANFVRLIATQVITIALLLLFTQHLLFAFILLFDFTARVLNFKQLSPFALVAKNIINYFQIKAQPCDEAPKRFALYLGLSIVSLLTFFYSVKLSIIASTLVIILLICAFLEAVFDYCIGCKVYYLLQMLTKKR